MKPRPICSAWQRKDYCCLSAAGITPVKRSTTGRRNPGIILRSRVVGVCGGQLVKDYGIRCCHEYIPLFILVPVFKGCALL